MAEPQQQQEAAPPAPPAEDKPAEGQTNLPILVRAEELLTKLSEKEKALIERETAFDKKMKEFDNKAAEAKLSGYGIYKQEPSEEEKAEKDARKLIAGTGFERYLPKQEK